MTTEDVYSELRILADTIESVVNNNPQYTKDEILSHFIFVPTECRKSGGRIVFKGNWVFDSKELPNSIKDEIEYSLKEIVQLRVFSL